MSDKKKPTRKRAVSSTRFQAPFEKVAKQGTTIDGKDIDKMDFEQTNSKHLGEVLVGAAAVYDFEEFSRCIKKNADVNHISATGHTALHVAAHCNSERMVDELTATGKLDLSIKTPDNMLASEVAGCAGHHVLSDKLMEMEARYFIKHDMWPGTPEALEATKREFNI